jgi:hypothetical protein
MLMLIYDITSISPPKFFSYPKSWIFVVMFIYDITSISPPKLCSFCLVDFNLYDSALSSWTTYMLT